VPAQAEDVLRRVYSGFNERDLERSLAAVHREIDWPNPGQPRHIHGRDELREYWGHVIATTDATVDPFRFTARDDGSMAVDVHRIVRSDDGGVVEEGDVVHVYTFREGLVESMEIEA
jgi:ketosteroid isomerase-like protein